MHNKVQSAALNAGAIAMISILAACGGGTGGGVVDQPPVVQPPPPPPVNTTPQTSTYLAGSGEKAAFELLNAERGRCGFGFLKQNGQLDLAAADTINYAKLRSTESYAQELAFVHTESPSKSGFTGAQPYDRAAYRGFTAIPLFESFSAHRQTAPLASSSAVNAARQTAVLLTTVYHLREQVSTATEVGISHGEMTSSDGIYTTRLEFLFGTPTGSTWQAPEGVQTYPCEGTTAAIGTFEPRYETPNPAPDLGSASMGTPIYVRGSANIPMTAVVASVKLTSTGTEVPVRVLTSSNDPQSMLYLEDAFVLPLQPLLPGQSYTVSVSGKSGTQAFSKTFSFTPAAPIPW